MSDIPQRITCNKHVVRDVVHTPSSVFWDMLPKEVFDFRPLTDYLRIIRAPVVDIKALTALYFVKFCRVKAGS